MLVWLWPYVYHWLASPCLFATTACGHAFNESQVNYSWEKKQMSMQLVTKRALEAFIE